ncbi:MAG: hypothetical protein JWP07_2837, partial [Pseudonocardiales bacterium]|nr:hypothetical protein [Pseudonocardiales bacterium]
IRQGSTTATTGPPSLRTTGHSGPSKCPRRSPAYQADECVSNPVPEVLSLGSPAASRASRLALSCATDATEVISCWSTRTRHRQERRLPQDGRDHQRSDERPMVGAVIAEQKPVHECSRNHGHQDQKSDRPNREKWLRHIVEVPADSSHGGLLPANDSEFPLRKLIGRAAHLMRHERNAMPQCRSAAEPIEPLHHIRRSLPGDYRLFGRRSLGAL